MHQIRSTTSLLLGYAIRDLFPAAKLLEGGITDLGFFYDFILSEKLDHQALKNITERLLSLSRKNLTIIEHEMVAANAKELFKYHGHKEKANLLTNQPNELVHVAQIEEYYDIATPPLLSSTQSIKAIHLETIEIIKGVTRIQGVVFSDQKDLKKYLKKAVVAKQKDHRTLGRELNLFSCNNSLSEGGWFWHPKGTILRELLLEWWKQEHTSQGFSSVVSPPFIKPNALQRVEIKHCPSVEIEGQHYIFPPNLAPMHSLLYQTHLHSYRELPIRYAEFTQLISPSRGSHLMGLMRARSYYVDLSHSFTTKDQVFDEVISSLQFIHKSINILGFEYRWCLLTRGRKYAGTLANWEMAIEWLRSGLVECGYDFDEDHTVEPFQGPRIEVQFIDSLGREWKGPYLGIDFHHPECFGLKYQGSDDQMHMPIMINRAMFGSLERIIAILLEHHAGYLPLWLAPEQVRVLAVGDQNAAYAEQLMAEIKSAGFRVCFEGKKGTLAEKIRMASLEKVPLVVIVGDKERKSNSITVRSGSTPRIGKLEDFLAEWKQQVLERR